MLRSPNRDGRIRTGDPLNPIQVRYRAAHVPLWYFLPVGKRFIRFPRIAADERVCTLVCMLGGSLGLPKLTSMQNGLQDSRRISLLVEILDDLVCLPSNGS